MAGPSEYIRSLGFTPLVIRPLTPKLFLKQRPRGEDEDEANTLGKAFLATVAEKEGPVLVLLHSQSNTRDVFLPLADVSAVRRLPEFERGQDSEGSSQEATALHLSLPGETPLGGPRDVVLWSPDPSVGREVEGLVGGRGGV